MVFTGHCVEIGNTTQKKKQKKLRNHAEKKKTNVFEIYGRVSIQKQT